MKLALRTVEIYSFVKIMNEQSPQKVM